MTAMRSKEDLLTVLERLPSVSLARMVRKAEGEDSGSGAHTVTEGELDKRIDAHLYSLRDSDAESESYEDSDSEENSKIEKKRGLSWGKRVNLSIQRFGQQVKRVTIDVIRFFALFSFIEGHVERYLGPTAVAYFKLLAFLFWMNAFVQLLLLCFITIAYLAQLDFSGQTLTTAFDFTFVSIWLAPPSSNIFFYTGYNGTSADGSYNLRAAYMYSMLAALAVYFLAVGFRLANRAASASLRNRNVPQGHRGPFAAVFMSALQLQRRADAALVHVYLHEVRAPATSNDCATRCRLITLRVFAWCLALAVIGGIGYAEYLLLQWKVQLVNESSKQDTLWLLPLLMTAIDVLVPLVLPLLTFLESYRSHYAGDATSLIRITLLRCVTVGVLTAFSVFNDPEVGSNESWEYQFGSFVYRLVLFELTAVALFTLVVDGGWKVLVLLVNKPSAKAKKQVTPQDESERQLQTAQTSGCVVHLKPLKFRAVNDALNIVYVQMLVWLAVFYAPLLPGVLCVLLLFIMIIKALISTSCCRRKAALLQGESVEKVLAYSLCFALLFTLACIFIFLYYKEPSEGSLFGELDWVLQFVEVMLAAAETVLLVLFDELFSLGGMSALLVLVIASVVFAGMRSRGYGDAERKLKEKVSSELRDIAFYNRTLRNSMAHLAEHRRVPASNTVASQFVGSQFSQLVMQPLAPRYVQSPLEPPTISRLRAHFSVSTRSLLPALLCTARTSTLSTAPQHPDRLSQTVLNPVYTASAISRDSHQDDMNESARHSSKIPLTVVAEVHSEPHSHLVHDVQSHVATSARPSMESTRTQVELQPTEATVLLRTNAGEGAKQPVNSTNRVSSTYETIAEPAVATPLRTFHEETPADVIEYDSCQL